MNENSAVDVLHEAGEAYGRGAEREIVKDEVLALLDKYIEDLSVGSSLDNPSVRVAVMHLRDVRNKVDTLI